MAVAAYCIGYENDLQKEKTKVKRELKGKIENQIKAPEEWKNRKISCLQNEKRISGNFYR